MAKIYLSTLDTTFLTFTTRKYVKDNNVRFNSFDDYAMFIYYKICNEDTERYYEILEDDLKEYINFQKGGKRNALQNTKKKES